MLTSLRNLSESPRLQTKNNQYIYARNTPTATIEIYITNPELLGKFKPGDKYYVDFKPAV